MEKPSSHQQHIFEFVAAGIGHGVVRATAGSGKTTTLVEAAHYLPPQSRAGFVAFNVHAANQLRQRLVPTVEAKTIHALGLQMLREHLNEPREEIQVIPTKLKKHAETILRRDHRSARWSRANQRACVKYLQNLADIIRLDLCSPEKLPDLTEKQHLMLPDIDVPDLRGVLQELVWDVLELGYLECEQGLVDYQDMLFYPVLKQLRLARPFDFLFVDECQDLSKAGLAMIRQTLTPSGRLLMVGDADQAIYGFSGADAQAMDRIVAQTQPTELPLSITYRCPRSHVALAKHFSPRIEAAPEACEGEILFLTDEAFASHVRPGDLVLCRTNAPLIRAALQVIRQGVAARVLGGDVAATLKRDANETLHGPPDTWEALLTQHETLKLRTISESPLDSVSKDRKLRQREDELASLRSMVQALLQEGIQHVGELHTRIDSLFTSSRAATFSTVHKAKGKEAQRVFIYHPHLMPLKNLRSVVDQAGERCVQFVAVTRARESLFFVESVEEPNGERWWRNPTQRTTI